MSNTSKPEEYERCVLCGAVTSVPVSMPIEWREDYELGCGQLCVNCSRALREGTLPKKPKKD